LYCQLYVWFLTNQRNIQRTGNVTFTECPDETMNNELARITIEIGLDVQWNGGQTTTIQPP